jgi:enoyl-CoA hydratase/carnithine racemase
VITQSRSGDILTMAIDNAAKANSLTADMLTGLVDAFTAASADQSLRAVLLTSRGEAGFSAGMDTAQFDHEDPERAYATITHLGEVCEAVKNCDLPVATAIRGYCVGGALEVAAAADYRVGAADSWYSMPEVRIGIPSVLDAANLWRVMGWTKATELIMTANRFTADDMDRCGYLNAVVEADQVEERALAYLRDTMESDRAVIAQQKRLFRTWRNTHEQVAIADSRKEFSLAFARKAAVNARTRAAGEE